MALSSSLQLAALEVLSDHSTVDVTDSVTWSSNLPGIVSISATGLASGVSLGQAIITATQSSGSLGSTTLDVCVPVTSGLNVGVLNPANVISSSTGTVDVTVDIPNCVESIGIIVRGSNAGIKYVEHRGLVLGGDPSTFEYITGPSGEPVPLSHNQIDWLDANGNLGSDGVEEDYLDNLYNYEAEALFFHNNGSNALLPAGTYTFPVGSADPNSGLLDVDTLTPTVYYKNHTAAQQNMIVNLWVVNGVGAGITSLATAQGDAEIQGAIAVLQNVYGTQTGLNLTVNVRFVSDTNFADLGTLSEQDMLVTGYPNPPENNALNLFIVGQITWVDGGGQYGVIGLSLGIPGPFNLDGTIVSGTLAEYQGDGVGNILGFTLAHEFGHFVGLWHTSQTDETLTAIIGHDPIADTLECTTEQLSMVNDIDNCLDRGNLMFPYVDNNPTPPITTQQARVIELNPAVSSP